MEYYSGQSPWGVHMENSHSLSSKQRSRDMDCIPEVFLRLLIQSNGLWIGLSILSSTMFELALTTSLSLIPPKSSLMIPKTEGRVLYIDFARKPTGRISPNSSTKSR